MWCVGLFNSVYVQWNLYYNCKFTKFDTKLNVQIPVKSVHRNRNKNDLPVPELQPEPEFRSIYDSDLHWLIQHAFLSTSAGMVEYYNIVPTQVEGGAA